MAIPARNEAARIGQALDSAARVADGWLASLHVVVAVNSSTETTAAIAARFRARHFRLVVDIVTLAAVRAHARGARRVALDRAGTIPRRGISGPGVPIWR